MNTTELLKFYGSDLKAAVSIGVSGQTIRNWIGAKKIPDHMQLAIQTLSKGKLKADEKCFK